MISESFKDNISSQSISKSTSKVESENVVFKKIYDGVSCCQHDIYDTKLQLYVVK